MMKNKILLFLTVIAFTACEQAQPKMEVKVDKADATAYQDPSSGLYIFIKSTPKKEIAKRFPVIRRDLIQEKAKEIKNMNIGQMVTGIPNALNDITFDRQVEVMIQLTQQDYPEANGIIFTKLNECTPILFKE